MCVCCSHSDVLSDEMMKSCVIYSQWLVDASKVSDDDKVKILMFVTLMYSQLHVL